MYNISLRILKDSYEAEDVMQESFLIAFEKLGTFKGEVTFGAWLKRIVINKSITHLRKNSKYQTVTLDVVPDQDDSSGQSDDNDYSKVRAKQLLECIKRFNPTANKWILYNEIQ